MLKASQAEEVTEKPESQGASFADAVGTDMLRNAVGWCVTLCDSISPGNLTEPSQEWPGPATVRMTIGVNAVLLHCSPSIPEV